LMAAKGYEAFNDELEPSGLKSGPWNHLW
jgi:hypothetical protein